MKLKLMLIVTVLLVSVSGVFAELHDRGGGLIYDDALNITWLQDANLPASETFGVGGIGLWGPGKMNWDTAMAWINAMNANNYLGHSEWRLPKTRPVNSVNFNYDWSYDGSTDRGYNISAPDSPYPGSTGSEMAYLFYNSLGNIGQYNINGNYNNEGEWGLKNTGPFINMEAAAYWSLTEYAPETDNAWYFDFYDGYQYDQPKENIHYYAWAVRDGDVIPHIHCVGTTSELQDAINVASNNSTEDIIKIKQGTYNGNFIYASTEPYGVTIEGGYLPGCDSMVVDPTNTLLDAGGNGHVLVLSAPDVAADFVVEGISIQNGKTTGSKGAGLYVTSDSNISVLTNQIINNDANGPNDGTGGGVYIYTEGDGIIRMFGVGPR